MGGGEMRIIPQLVTGALVFSAPGVLWAAPALGDATPGTYAARKAGIHSQHTNALARVVQQYRTDLRTLGSQCWKRKDHARVAALKAELARLERQGTIPRAADQHSDMVAMAREAYFKRAKEIAVARDKALSDLISAFEKQVTEEVHALEAKGQDRAAKDLRRFLAQVAFERDDLLPRTPADLRVEPVSPKSIRVTWREWPRNADEMVVQRKRLPDGEWVALPAISNPTNACLDTDLKPQQAYAYRAGAIGYAGDSLFSVEVSTNTPVDVNMAGTGGRTELWVAANRGRDAEVKRLLAQSADPNVADDNGVTPLAEAVYRNRLSCVELLIAGGASVDKGNNDSRTPLW